MTNSLANDVNVETNEIATNNMLSNKSKDTKAVLGKTLLFTDEHVQEEQLRLQIKQAEMEKNILQSIVQTFAQVYNRKFFEEIAEITILQAEHQNLVAKLADKSPAFNDAFIGMGGMNDSIREEAPERNFDNLSEPEQKEIKEIYKFLAKKLHPDMHPNASETEKEGYKKLFQLMSETYEKGDIECLRILAKGFNWEILKNNQQEENNTVSKEDILAILWSFLEELKADIRKLENSDSYKNYLKSEEEQTLWRTEEKARFDRDIKNYKEQIEVLLSILESLTQDEQRKGE